MEPDLKARMSPGLKGREMTLGLFCSHSFSEKEVLIRAHLRHNSLAQMKARKQTHNCCEWEQRSQEEHVRSFPCELCSVSDAHQQSHHCLRWELPNIQDCPRDPASPPKAAHLELGMGPWLQHGRGEIERRDSPRKRKCLKNIIDIGRNSIWRQSIACSADTWALEQFENNSENPSCSPRGNLKWHFKAEHPQALGSPPGKISGHLLPLHPAPSSWSEPSHSFPGSDTLSVTSLGDPPWFPLHKPQKWPCSRPHGAPTTKQHEHRTWYSWKPERAISLSYLARQSDHRISHTYSSDLVTPNILILSRLQCLNQNLGMEWNGLILSSGRKGLGWVVPLWRHQATCNSLPSRKAKEDKRTRINILVLWSEDKNSFEPQTEYSLWPSAS